MVSFRNGVLRIEKDSELVRSQKYRFAYEICLYLGINCYYIVDSRTVHYTGVAAFIAGVIIITLDKLRLSRLNKPLLTFWYLGVVALCEISSIWAYSPVSTATKYIKMLLMSVVIGFGLIQYVDDDDDIEDLLDVFLYSALTLALIQFIFTPFDRWYYGYFGAYIGKSNTNTFGYVLLFAAIVAFYKAFRKKQNLWYIGAAIFLYGCILSSSRKAVAISAFGILCIILLSFKRKKNNLLYLALAAAAGIVAMYIFMNNENMYQAIGGRLKTLSNFLKGNYNPEDQSSLQLRDFYITFAKELFERKPILGNGFNSFHFLLAAETDRGKAYAHNNYWEILADLGLVGFFTYYWAYAYMLYKQIGAFLSNTFDDIKCLGFVMLVSEMILEWGVVSLYNLYCQLIIALIFICCCKSGSKKKYYYSGQKNGGV